MQFFIFRNFTEYEFKEARDESFYQLHPEEASYGIKIWSFDELAIKEKAREYFMPGSPKSLSSVRKKKRRDTTLIFSLSPVHFTIRIFLCTPILQANNQPYQDSDKPEESVLSSQTISKLNALLLTKGIISLKEACAVTGYDDPDVLIQGFGIQAVLV